MFSIFLLGLSESDVQRSGRVESGRVGLCQAGPSRAGLHGQDSCKLQRVGSGLVENCRNLLLFVCRKNSFA